MTLRNQIILLVCALAVTCSIGSVYAATLELSGPAGASCVINGQDLGFFPLEGPMDLESGIYTITATMPGFFPYEKTINLESQQDWVRIHASLVPLKKSTALKSNLLFAGLGQFYMGKKAKGWTFVLAESGGLLVALAGEAQRTNYRNDYLLFEESYSASINGDEIASYRSKSETAYSNMEDMENLRNLGLMVAGGAIVLSLLDALFLFPSAEVGTGSVPIQTGYHSLDNQGFTSFHAGIRVGF